ncbi:MAG: TRAP transporter large permease subunit [Candidatus Eremiobacteraeota bacterium]|nr:TRAP transporter large permease subunit [Candidatus Eremiobacteraeota bacterium]
MATTVERIIAAENAVDATPLAHGGLRRSWTIAVDRIVGAIVEPIVAAIIVIEVIILASGVFSRYVLHDALTWTDELATFLFLWMTMLGAVIAYRRGEHMRLNAVVRLASEPVRRTLDVISSVVVALFCIELIPASRTFYELEKIDLTPALGFPRSLEIAAILTGLSLILLLAVLRLIDSEMKRVVPVVIVAVLLSWGAVALHPVIASLGNINLVFFFVILVGACVAIGVPIAFSFGFGTLSYLALATSNPLSTVVGRMNEGISNLILLAIPLFVLLGVLLEGAGIAKRLVGALASLVGHFRGGLNIVLIGAMYLVSGISGSKTADMAAVAPVLFPEMERRGQKRSEMISLLATSGAMAETIPPSLVLIIIGTVAGVSIRDLCTAGLLPAAVAAIALLVVALARSRSDRTELAKRPSAGFIAKAFFVAIPGLLLPLLIRFFVVAGIATATEVSTVGIVYSLFVGIFIYREFNWSRAYPMLRETGGLTGAIMLIIATATSMGWALTQSGFAQQLATALSHAGGAAGFMALSVVLFIVLGSVLEGIPAIVLFGPLLFPIAQQYGINEVHYAVVAVLAMGMGLFSPPLGIGYYGACAIGKCPPEQAVKPMIPYLLALLVAIILIAAIPWLSTGFLPKA